MGSLNDSPFGNTLLPGEVRNRRNMRVVPSIPLEKLSGRSSIQDAIQGVVRDFIIPPKRWPIVTITSANKALYFSYGGVNYTAYLAEGVYYTYAELQSALEVALEAATVGVTEWTIGLTESSATGDYGEAIIGPENGTLYGDHAIGSATVTITYSTGMTVADWRLNDGGAGEVHHVIIGTETLTYVNAADDGLGHIVLTLSSNTTVEHLDGDDVIMMYDAAADATTDHGRFYWFIGGTGQPPSGNKLDGDGDGTDDTDGYVLGD